MKNAKQIVVDFQKEMKQARYVGLAVSASLDNGKDCGFYVKADNKYNLLALVANVVVHSATAFEVSPTRMLELLQTSLEKKCRKVHLTLR